jgi:hypothetical protein
VAFANFCGVNSLPWPISSYQCDFILLGAGEKGSEVLRDSIFPPFRYNEYV